MQTVPASAIFVVTCCGADYTASLSQPLSHAPTAGSNKENRMPVDEDFSKITSLEDIAALLEMADRRYGLHCVLYCTVSLMAVL